MQPWASRSDPTAGGCFSEVLGSSGPGSEQPINKAAIERNTSEVVRIVCSIASSLILRLLRLAALALARRMVRGCAPHILASRNASPFIFLHYATLSSRAGNASWIPVQSVIASKTSPCVRLWPVDPGLRLRPEKHRPHRRSPCCRCPFLSGSRPYASRRQNCQVILQCLAADGSANVSSWPGPAVSRPSLSRVSKYCSGQPRMAPRSSVPGRLRSLATQTNRSPYQHGRPVLRRRSYVRFSRSRSSHRCAPR